MKKNRQMMKMLLTGINVDTLCVRKKDIEVKSSDVEKKRKIHKYVEAEKENVENKEKG